MLFKQNLYKSSYVSLSSDEVRVIDSDSRLMQQMDGLMDESELQDMQVSDYIPQSFDEEADPMAALFGEAPEGEDVDGMEFMADGMDASDMEGMEGAGSAVVGHEIEPHAGEAAQEAKRIIEEAQQQAQVIIDQALGQAEAEVNQAYENAKEQGYQDGFQEGQMQLEQQLNMRMQELDQKEMERRHKYDEMVSELEPHMVRELTAIYEHLIGIELSQYKSVLSHLIANTLHSTESSENYLIHVSSQDFSYVSMQKNQIIEECGIKNATIDVVEDMTLSKNQCLVETDSGIFDCSLAVQMEELKRKLTLLSYRTE